MMIHKHHIIPRHMGGTDDESNLIKLTADEHAEAHRLLYEQHGCWQDYLAWKGLAGLSSKEEIIQMMYEERRGEKNPMYGKPCYHNMTEDQKQQWKTNISKSLKGKKKSQEWKDKMRWDGEYNPNYGKIPWNKGKKGLQQKSLESKKKVSKPVVFRGIEYYSITEAAKQNNTTVYYVKKEIRATSK